jgi:hypothetical protein
MEPDDQPDAVGETTETPGDMVALWKRIPLAARFIAAAVLVAGVLGALALTAGTSPAACAKLVAAGTSELDTRATWTQANNDRDDATTAWMKGADYVVVTDAEAKSDAASKIFLTASFNYVNVKRATSGCQNVDTAFEAVKTARDLVTHKSAGAAAKLAAADAEWARLAAN